MGWEIHIYLDGEWEYWDFCTTFEQVRFWETRFAEQGVPTRVVEYGSADSVLAKK